MKSNTKALVVIAIAILIAAMFAVFQQTQKETSAIEIAVQINYKDGSSMPVSGLSVVDTSGKNVASISLSATLYTEYTGTVTTSSFTGLLQTKFDNVQKQQVSLQLPQSIVSGQKCILGQTITLESDITGWVGTAFGTHVLSYTVPSGAVLNVIFSDGKTETKTFQAASASVSLNVQSDSGITVTYVTIETATTEPTPPVTTPPPFGVTVLFQDDFERGNFYAWSWADTSDVGASITISSTKAYNGIYSAKSSRDGSVVDQYARLHRKFGVLHKEISLEAHILISKLPSAEGQVCLLSLIHDGVGFCSELALAKWSDGSVSCYISYYANGGMQYLWGIPAPTPNVWTGYKLHFKSDVADGKIELYINGMLTNSDSGFDSSGIGGVDMIRLNRFGVGTFAMDTYFDSVVTTVPEDVEPLSNVNLAEIPDDWGLTYGSGPQIIFLDYNVVRTPGKPSIRLEPHTSNDVNSARECDGMWYPVKAGDHVVAKCWMRVLTDSSTPYYPYCGARIGMDFYGYVNGVYTGLGASDFWDAYYNGGHYELGYVQDSNGGAWQQRTIDIIVPATAKDANGNVGIVTEIVIWMQGGGWTIPTMSPCWFADAELYINPS